MTNPPDPTPDVVGGPKRLKKTPKKVTPKKKVSKKQTPKKKKGKSKRKK